LKLAGKRLPCAQVVAQGLLAQQPTKFLEENQCQAVVSMYSEEKQTYIPVAHAYHVDPEGHFGPKKGRADDDMM
jgi:hypothetical protein